jgi:hypothetical protein
VTASLLLAEITPEATSTTVQLQQDITTREYWIERGYEVISDMWCAGTNTMVQLHKDHEVITINYEEHRVSSCYGGYDGCYVDFIDEVKVLHTEE